MKQFVAKLQLKIQKQPLGEQNQMAQTVRLDDDFIADVKIHASAAHRSLPKQIEYWSKIGRMVEDNPDLPFSFIKDVMLAAEQVKEGQLTRYVRRTKRV
ncbi:ParD-like family protein [Aeromonas veronii]|nr:ParD-like family protein [Aeromonas veronii]